MTKDEYEDFVLRYKGCGACFPMYHTLNRFEKMWFTAIQKDVAELEKENAELKADNDARKFAMAMSEKVEKQLREENEKLRKEWQEQVQKTTDEGYARTLQTIQLSKAKELLEDLIRFQPYINKEAIFLSIGNEWKTAIYKAKQFLNSEVEK